MIPNQRNKFTITKGFTYLNCAYMSPMLKSVEMVGIESIKMKRNPFQIGAEDFFTDSIKIRKEYAKLISGEADRVVLIPSASYGIASVVNNIVLKSTDHVLVAEAQFPSNYYPWQRLAEEYRASIKVVSPPDSTTNRGKQWNERILEAININTRVVALGNVHWADGTLFNLKEIRARATEVGALLIIDGTQSVGALPFSVKEIKPDALICAGYKWLMGPYSLGFAYYGEFFDNGKPIEENWINRLNSENFTGLVNYQPQYQPGALRYEVGEHSNFILLPMLLEAIKQINQWKPKSIQQYCKKISEQAIDDLRQNGFWIEDDQYRAYHLFGIRLPAKTNIDKVKKTLTKNKISVSYRGDAIRVSPHLYNSEREMRKLSVALINNI